jgi:hypothetical protein
LNPTYLEPVPAVVSRTTVTERSVVNSIDASSVLFAPAAGCVVRPELIAA